MTVNTAPVRRKIDLSLVGLGLTLLLQVSSLVWFAAKMESAVQQQTIATQELRATTANLGEALGELQRQVAILFDRSERDRARGL